MKAIRVYEFGGAENLRLEEIEKPVPNSNQVLIRTEVAGLNFTDISRRRGEFAAKTSLPYIPGLEAAGFIEAIGQNISGFTVGDRVLAHVQLNAYAEYAVAGPEQLISVPEGLSFAEASALLVQGMTALGLLQDVKAGQTILIHAAAGGVGTILVQLAKHKGLKVIGTASSSGKLKKIKELGADTAVDYTRAGWTEKVLEATGNKGVDRIIEMIGGEIVSENLKVLGIGGVMIVYGTVTEQDHKISVLDLIDKNHTVRGYWLSLESTDAKALFARELFEHVIAGRLKISVTEFPLEQAAEAHRAIEERKTTGKVVLTI
jgi:NADPH2:quinone reductase